MGVYGCNYIGFAQSEIHSLLYLERNTAWANSCMAFHLEGFPCLWTSVPLTPGEFFLDLVLLFGMSVPSRISVSGTRRNIKLMLLLFCYPWAILSATEPYRFVD